MFTGLSVVCSPGFSRFHLLSFASVMSHGVMVSTLGRVVQSRVKMTQG